MLTYRGALDACWVVVVVAVVIIILIMIIIIIIIVVIITAASEPSGLQQETADRWSQIDHKDWQESSGGYKPSTTPTYYGGTERRADGIASTVRQLRPRRHFFWLSHAGRGKDHSPLSSWH